MLQVHHDRLVLVQVIQVIIQKLLELKQQLKLNCKLVGIFNLQDIE